MFHVISYIDLILSKDVIKKKDKIVVRKEKTYNFHGPFLNLFSFTHSWVFLKYVTVKML